MSQMMCLSINGLNMAIILSLLSLTANAGVSDEKTLGNLLVQDCGSCHGLQMKGGLGPALLPDNLKNKSDATLVSTILDGRPGTAMPPWRTMLNESQARWMVKQLRRGL